MSKNKPKSLSELIFRPGSALNDLARRAEASLDLAETLRAGLPREMSGELRSASLHDDGTLLVLAGSPAWAARLRFEGDALLARCRERHPQTKRIKVRVSGTSGTDSG